MADATDGGSLESGRPHPGHAAASLKEPRHDTPPALRCLQDPAASDGILSVPVNGNAAFAVATINLGVEAPITASVDTGRATPPVQALLCQTDPANGQCLAPPSATVMLDDAAGATPTFSVFVEASGSIALAPATARLFVRFADSAGNPRGATSVAVEAQ